jgi:hypothetical protein
MIRPGALFLHKISNFIPTTIAMCCVCDNRKIIIYDFAYKQFYHYNRSYAEANFFL